MDKIKQQSLQKITDKPLNFYSQRNWKVLSIEKNQITHIPEEIGQLTTLTSLRIFFNNLSEEELGKAFNLLPTTSFPW